MRIAQKKRTNKTKEANFRIESIKQKKNGSQG